MISSEIEAHDGELYVETIDLPGTYLHSDDDDEEIAMLLKVRTALLDGISRNRALSKICYR